MADLEEQMFLQDFNAHRFRISSDDPQADDKCSALLYHFYKDCGKLPTSVRVNAFSNIFSFVDNNNNTQHWLVLAFDEVYKQMRPLYEKPWETYPSHVLAMFCHRDGIGLSSDALDFLHTHLPPGKFVEFFLAHCLVGSFPDFLGFFGERNVDSLAPIFLAPFDHKEVPILSPESGTKFYAYRTA
jgi:hypothetical protein